MAFSCDPALTRKPAPLTFLERAASLQPAVLVLALPPLPASTPFPSPMNRREAAERISLLLGGTLSVELTAGLMGQVIHPGPNVAVSVAQQALLAEVADVIIPTTDTPGAKAAGAEQFIIRVMRDCYPLQEQEAFYAGLAKLEADSQSAHGKAFADLESNAKIQLVQQTAEMNRAFFKRLKELTVTGYFTSEIGATRALAYLPVPGRFAGDVPMEKGQKTWAL